MTQDTDLGDTTGCFSHSGFCESSPQRPRSCLITRQFLTVGDGVFASTEQNNGGRPEQSEVQVFQHASIDSALPSCTRHNLRISSRCCHSHTPPCSSAHDCIDPNPLPEFWLPCRTHPQRKEGGTEGMPQNLVVWQTLQTRAWKPVGRKRQRHPHPVYDTRHSFWSSTSGWIPQS